jgi:hypothetical protein
MKIKNFLLGIKDGQKLFGEVVSSVINFITLSMVYLFGVGITSIIGKGLRKKYLDKKADKNKETYWEDLNLNTKIMEDYYRQF